MNNWYSKGSMIDGRSGDYLLPPMTPGEFWRRARRQTHWAGRRLQEWEMKEFLPVFGDTLDYSRVYIHENNPLPDRIDRIGRILKRQPPAGPESHNAITLGNHCYFPVGLPTRPLSLEDPEFYKLAWLVHELTHVWQYQRQGWGYLFRALRAQFAQGANAYGYGREEGLAKARSADLRFTDFNPEQQGDIVRDFYTHLRRRQDVSAYEPFIAELQNRRPPSAV